MLLIMRRPSQSKSGDFQGSKLKFGFVLVDSWGPSPVPLLAKMDIQAGEREVFSKPSKHSSGTLCAVFFCVGVYMGISSAFW
ncbi:hypothetical protein ACSS6W_010827 [Trichoderma asperelloides]